MNLFDFITTYAPELASFKDDSIYNLYLQNKPKRLRDLSKETPTKNLSNPHHHPNHNHSHIPNNLLAINLNQNQIRNNKENKETKEEKLKKEPIRIELAEMLGIEMKELMTEGIIDQETKDLREMKDKQIEEMIEKKEEIEVKEVKELKEVIEVNDRKTEERDLKGIKVYNV